MKKNSLLALCAIATCFCVLITNAKTKSKIAVKTKTKVTAVTKPKIVIFTSKGGNGHMSTCEALKDILPDCEIKLVRPIHDFFNKFFDEEEWYGYFLKNGWIRTGNFIARYPGKCF